MLHVSIIIITLCRPFLLYIKRTRMYHLITQFITIYIVYSLTLSSISNNNKYNAPPTLDKITPTFPEWA